MGNQPAKQRRDRTPSRDRQQRSTRRAGNWMSTKEMARTVIDGKRLHIHLADGGNVSGYLAGMDDFHWRVVDPQDGTVWLVHKAGASVQIGTASYLDEASKDDLEAVIAPFRDWVLRTFYGRQEAS